MSDSETISRTERHIRAGQTVRIIVWLVVLGAVVVFGALNTNKVNVDWAFGNADAPLWVVIGASALAGVVIGFAARHRGT